MALLLSYAKVVGSSPIYFILCFAILSVDFWLSSRRIRWVLCAKDGEEGEGSMRRDGNVISGP